MFDIADQSQRLAVLDAPVAASFDHGWRRFAEPAGGGWMLPASIGPFATPGREPNCDPLRFADKVRTRKAPVILFQREGIEAPRGLSVIGRDNGLQMVLTRPVFSVDATGTLRLGAADASEMLALAERTAPGPFALQTHRLGEFIGLHVRGRLVAMAGQRMAVPGFTEVSGVCVDPDMRGRGYARRLVSAMVLRLQLRGITPFLHVYADNVGAIRLYQQLGFEIRTDMHLAKLG